MDKKIKKAGPSKKDTRAKLSTQLHTLLADFKDAVHEKKLQKLVKKAAKLLADGLHHNKPKPSVVKKKAAPKKKAAVKKAAPQKSSREEKINLSLTNPSYKRVPPLAGLFVSDR